MTTTEVSATTPVSADDIIHTAQSMCRSADARTAESAGERTNAQELLATGLRQFADLYEQASAQLVIASAELAQYREVFNFIGDDPRRIEQLRQLVDSELWARHLTIGNGDMTDLDALSASLDKLRMEGTPPHSTTPASPPTTSMAPPADSSDSNSGSQPRPRGRFRQNMYELLHPEESKKKPSNS